MRNLISYKILVLCSFSLFLSKKIYSQIGYGPVKGFDYYQNRVFLDEKNSNNPQLREVHGVLLNGIGGYRVWLGNPSFSLSVEGQLNLSIASFSTSDQRNIFALSIPFLAKINIGGLSGFSDEKRLSKGKWALIGISLGMGYQINSDDDNETSYYFDTMVYEIGIGMGNGMKSMELAFRIGNGEKESKTFNVGLYYNFNMRGLK